MDLLIAVVTVDPIASRQGLVGCGTLTGTLNVMVPIGVTVAPPFAVPSADLLACSIESTPTAIAEA